MYWGGPFAITNDASPRLPWVNTVFTQGGLGDASFVIANGTTQYIGPLTTDRFAQPNHVYGGDLWLDWSAATSMTFSAVLLPTDAI